MDKETLTSKIAEKLGNTSLSTRSISDYAQNILPMITDDSQVTDAYIETHCNILKSIEGQMRHDISAQIESFKKGYKPEPDTGQGNQGGQPQHNDGMDAILKKLEAMEQSYNALKTDYDNQKTLAAQSAVKEEVIKKLRENIRQATGEAPNQFVLDATLRDLQIGENPDVSVLVTQMSANYNSNLKAAGIQTDAPYGGGGSGSGKTDMLDNFFAQKATEGKFPTK